MVDVVFGQNLEHKRRKEYMCRDVTCNVPTHWYIKFARIRRLPQSHLYPFHSSTVISFEIGSIQKVSLKVYNNQGRFVRSLLNNTIHVGKHEISWDGRNDQGDSVSTGIYYYRLEGACFSQTKKMILIR